MTTMLDRLDTSLCLFALTAALVSCSAAQKRDARTALQAIDTACDALEVAQVEQHVTLACELTDDLRDAAIAALKTRKKKHPHPKPAESAEPVDGGAP